MASYARDNDKVELSKDQDFASNNDISDSQLNRTGLNGDTEKQKEKQGTFALDRKLRFIRELFLFILLLICLCIIIYFTKKTENLLNKLEEGMPDMIEESTHYDSDCFENLICANGSVITTLEASSVYSLNNADHGPNQSCLDNVAIGHSGGWTPENKDKTPWIQAQLAGRKLIGQVITQGRQDAQQWVTKYRLAHSLDGVNWTTIGYGNGSAKIFDGNNDRDTHVVNHDLPFFFVAKYLRLYPQSYHWKKSLRWNIQGCDEEDNICHMNDLICTNGTPIAPISVSSTYSLDYIDHGPAHSCVDHQAQLGHVGGWSSGTIDSHPWIQATFSKPKTIKQIVTQGREDKEEWVESYKISYSQDGIHWRKATNTGGTAIEFSGNHDRNTRVVNDMPPGLVVRYIRLCPISWKGNASLRWEIIGCD